MSLGTRASEAVLSAFVIPLVGAVVACVGLAIFLCGDLVWIDFLHVNPNRSVSDTLGTMLLSPFLGLFLGVTLLGLPIAAGGVLAALSTLVWRRPSSTDMAAIAVLTTVLFVRWCYADAEAGAETADWRSYSPPWFTLIGGSALLTASLYAGWTVRGWMSAASGVADG